MILQEKFPRAAVTWILIAQCAVYLPHIPVMPVWLSLIYFSCLGWRLGVYQGRWDYPNNYMKFLLMIAAFLGVLFSFQTITGGKGGVALLLLAFAYKTLEMKEQRDAYLVIMLAYFVVACGFLFQRSFFAASYLFVCLSIVSAALISMNHLPKKPFDFAGLWLSTKMLLQALPLMAFLFVFFPQLPPVFQMNLGGVESKTGLSDTMNPGSISELTQSDELAFRVKFDGERPAQSKLYWRAQVFETFDGIGWKMSSQKKSDLKYNDVIQDELATDINTETYTYIIYQEASDQKMLFSLATAWSGQSGIQLNDDFTLSRNSKVDQLFQYKVQSNLSYIRSPELSRLSRQVNTNLPAYGNERSINFARNLRLEAGNDAQYISAILRHYREQNFQYTLKPPLTGENPVDDFLFETRKGFCEHFASSFVFLMRAAGIPARVVGGYMGGEYNSNGDYLLVHQFDAHAWAEVWMDGDGWIRFDPTSLVAPERISQGIEQALPEGESILEGNILSARKFNPLTTIRLRLDYLNMQWDKWVLGYNEEKQQQIWQAILGEVNAQRVALFMAICFFLVVFSTVITMYLKDFFRIKDPADRMFIKMEKKLKRKKIYRMPYETPNEFADRVSLKNEALGLKLEKFIAFYVIWKYQKGDELADKKEAQGRKELLNNMKQALAGLS